MKKILCLGGSGTLGSRVISIMKNYQITNVDFKANFEAKANILLRSDLDATANNKSVIENIKSGSLKFDSIIVTAGGWVGGNIKDDDYFAKVKQMNEVCLYPSLLGAHLATKYLEPNGTVIFTGAAAVFKEPQPDMLAYAIAKTGVHSLAMSLSENAHKFEGRVITILPETIDSESNRIAMPTADFTKWSKPEQIGQLLKGWIDGLNVPNNGSFVVLSVKNGCVVP